MPAAEGLVGLLVLVSAVRQFIGAFVGLGFLVLAAVAMAAPPSPKPLGEFQSFEERQVSDYWRVAPGRGSLQVSARHYKHGKQSLRWQWEQGGALTCEGIKISPEQSDVSSPEGMEGWVYCEKPVDGRLTFRLGSKAQLAAGTPTFQFRFGLNFTGWRMLKVNFERDTKVPNTTTGIADVEALEIVPPEKAPAGEVYLDAIRIAKALPLKRSADYQIPEHADGLGGWCDHWPLHYSKESPSLPLPAEITAGEKRDFATISGRYRKWILGRNPDVTKPMLQKGAEQTEAYVRRGWTQLKALGIVRDEQGRITGPGLVKDFSSRTSFKHVFYDILLPLVFDYKLNGNAEARDAALTVFDYVHDQGWAEGSGLGDLWLNPLGFAPYCHAIAMMRDELQASGRLEPATRTALWYLTFGKSFSRFDQDYIETNADELRSIVFTSLVIILTMDDTPQKVQYMRGWLAWFNNAVAISPRFGGVFKPDGVGFHHRAYYASAYTPESYEFCALLVWLLHGTEFSAAPASVANLANAVRTQMIVSQKYDVPYATRGRMPYSNTIVIASYAYLALAGKPVDPEMAGLFMRWWDADNWSWFGGVDLDASGGKFLCYQTPGRLQLMQELADRKLPAAAVPQGFWSLPWGALAIHRRDDWLVSVKGWSQYVWDFEMHPKLWGMAQQNVYARYWSYGTLQPITHGSSIASGWNLYRGWDWSRWPGATTPHLTPNEIYDPNTSKHARWFSCETFVGGVRCEGRNGMFALKLHETLYDPTFRANKTYFFFDNEIICLGSNIETHDAAHDTETTLFQSFMPEENMPISVNGEAVAAFPYEYRGEAGKALTLMDPYGNGYVIPDGGNVRLTRSRQESRDANNYSATAGVFSTCWLDHGKAPAAPTGVGYEYALLVQAKPDQVAAYATAAPYRVLQKDRRAHILQHFGQHTMAYALFETDWIVPHGVVRKTDTPVMAMVKETENGMLLCLADPDLRLPKRRSMDAVDEEAAATPSRPSVVRLELRGRWELKSPPTGVRVVGTSDETTTLEVTCRDGLTVQVGLKKARRASTDKGWRFRCRLRHYANNSPVNSPILTHMLS